MSNRYTDLYIATLARFILDWKKASLNRVPARMIEGNEATGKAARKATRSVPFFPKETVLSQH